MPFVRIDIQSGKSTAYKRAILASTRRAISSALGVGSERVLQRIAESPVDDIDVLERSDRFTLVEIAMKERDNERKQRLYAAVVNELGESPGIVAHDVAVYLIEQPGECFCTSGADIAGSDRADAVPSGADTPGRSGASGGDAADG